MPDLEFLKNINWTNSLCRKAGLTLAALLLFVLVLTTHAPKSSAKDGDSSSQKSEESSQAEQKPKYDTVYVKLDNELVKNGGLIGLDNKDHSYVSDGSGFVTIYPYLFNQKGEQVMSTSSTNISGTKEMMEQLNAMVSDFAAQTGLKTIMVTNASYLVDGKLYMTQYDVPQDGANNKAANSGSGNLSSGGCYEHLTGLAIDLQLYEADKGTYPEFTGEGQYAWINENCYKYGFVQRYPANKQEVTGAAEKKNHYRYVGKVYAKIMHDNDLALEELHAFLDKYSYEKPLNVDGIDGKNYIVYSALAEKDKTVTSVPHPDTGKDGELWANYSGIDNGRIYICVVVDSTSAPVASAESSKTE